MSEWQDIPEGWKLVPIEPTYSMSRAGRQALLKATVNAERGKWDRANSMQMWSAMLSAAPSPPSPKE